jgi:hypothetical protein
MTSNAKGPGRGVRLTFASGGWVLLLAGVLSLLAAGIWVGPVLLHPHSRAVGNGRTVDSYGFDLTTCLVSRTELVAAGIPKDGLPALNAPRTITPGEADALGAHEHGKFLVPGDVVIGVALAGEARAYPVRMLNWHEVVNDELGRTPIAVTYSPMGDAAVVLDRRVAGETLYFGVSGLLYNSNSLVYDRGREGRAESLWAPLQFRAVAGPAAAAGRTLTPVPCQLTRWDVWRARHPETTVLWPDPQFLPRYNSDPYSSDYGSDGLRFSVRPLPPAGAVPLKTPVVVLESGGRRVVFRAGPGGPAGAVRRFTLDGRAIVLRSAGPPPTVFVEAEDGGAPPVIAHAFWFAWRAMHPEDAPPE